MTSRASPRINGIAVIYRDPKSLKPHAQNPNTHSSKQIERIARGIKDFGWTNQIAADRDRLGGSG